jgi:transcriptional regulator with XRE-family HTH domain
MAINWDVLSNGDILKEIGKRIKDYRFGQKLTQRELSEQAGISLFTVAQMERGKSVSFNNLLAVLRILKLLDNLETLLPEICVSPVELLKLKGKTPQRIRKSKSK